MNAIVPTMSSTSLLCENERWPQSWPITNMPVQAVPANAQASGSRYQGEFWIRNAENATAATVVATAPQARSGLMSKTLDGIDLITSVSETPSGSSAPMVR